MKTKLTGILTLIAVVFSFQGVQAAEENREVAAFSEISLRVPATLHVKQGENTIGRNCCQGVGFGRNYHRSKGS